MSKIEIQKVTYKVKVSLDAADSEVILKRYTTTHHFRPDQIDITFVEYEPGALEFESALLVGNRALKDGSQGVSVSENIYGPSSLKEHFPEWVQNQITLAGIHVGKVIYGR